jgi:GT2 family glycosyltransferase
MTSRTADFGNSFSIIIATTGREEQLRRLLDGICRVNGREVTDPEVIIANNAPDETTAGVVEELTKEYSRREGINCWQVREPLPGKCRAQNRAIPQAKGSIFIFLDDDVEVNSSWLQSVAAFFTSHPHEVMQGSILMRDRDRENHQIRKALERYRTIDFIDYDFPPGADLKTLTGGNIAVRRKVFDRVGLFDHRLGPGQGGFSEDVEFAQRVIKGGFRIGYEPKAVVYNEIDWSRLTEEYFRIRHERQGRSRLIHKKNSIFSIIPNLMRSVWTFGWFSLVGNERRKYRAKGRYYHYLAMLREKTNWISE